MILCGRPELTKSIVRVVDGLATLLAHDANAHVCCLDHGHIIGSITNRQHLALLQHSQSHFESHSSLIHLGHKQIYFEGRNQNPESNLWSDRPTAFKVHQSFWLPVKFKSHPKTAQSSCRKCLLIERSGAYQSGHPYQDIDTELLRDLL